MFALIILVLVILIVLFIAGLYNKLVKMRALVKNAWSQIDVQLKRRYDLIPNLVETAKGYIKHERETLEAVVKARQMAIDVAARRDALDHLLSQVAALAEADRRVAAGLLQEHRVVHVDASPRDAGLHPQRIQRRHPERSRTSLAARIEQAGRRRRRPA